MLKSKSAGYFTVISQDTNDNPENKQNIIEQIEQSFDKADNLKDKITGLINLKSPRSLFKIIPFIEDNKITPQELSSAIEEVTQTAPMIGSIELVALYQLQTYCYFRITNAKIKNFFRTISLTNFLILVALFFVLIFFIFQNLMLQRENTQIKQHLDELNSTLFATIQQYKEEFAHISSSLSKIQHNNTNFWEDLTNIYLSSPNDKVISKFIQISGENPISFAFEYNVKGNESVYFDFNAIATLDFYDENFDSVNSIKVHLHPEKRKKPMKLLATSSTSELIVDNIDGYYETFLDNHFANIIFNTKPVLYSPDQKVFKDVAVKISKIESGLWAGKYGIEMSNPLPRYFLLGSEQYVNIFFIENEYKYETLDISISVPKDARYCRVFLTPDQTNFVPNTVISISNPRITE